MDLVSKSELEAAQSVVYRSMRPTASYSWPLLERESGLNLVVKHENHTPTGAFKVRGGLVFLDHLRKSNPEIDGICSATRGNHGQSLSFAARAVGIGCSILVPFGNAREKNAAMQAFGADLIEYGNDFDEARVYCETYASENGFYFVPSFHEKLIAGVGTYALEMLQDHADLDTIYVPIGMGSGICGLFSARAALGATTKIIGVVSEHADAYARSLEAGRIIETNSALTFADGMAVRVPHADAFRLIQSHVDEIVRVSEDEIAEAIRLYYFATHNVAEGAGAAPLAAALKNKEKHKGEQVGLILCGQNIDAAVLSVVLSGRTPQVGQSAEELK